MTRHDADGGWLPEGLWERAALPRPGFRVETAPDGTVLFRDGDWLLVDPQPTIGSHWRVFDGWWRPND